ncbi:MAG: hypothetical protein QOE26_1648 [Verrucomicrobiota bacterium]|jgi:hypothetical protein
MREFWVDLGTYLWSVVWRWINLIGCSTIAFTEVIYPKLTRSNEFPQGREFPVNSWWILGACLAYAMFLAWRDEREKVRCKNLRALLVKVTDSTQEVSVYMGSDRVISHREENIAALIRICDELENESGLKWILKQLVATGGTDPFQLYEMFYPKNIFSGKRLKFLRDARVSEGRHIKSDTDAIAYIRMYWGPRNGLREIDHPIYPVAVNNGWLTWNHAMCKPLSAAKAERLYLVPPQVLLSGGLQVKSTPPDVPSTLPLRENGNLLRSNRTKRLVADPHGCIPGVGRQR